MTETEPTLFRLRVRYQKAGRLIYLGHLEVARTVERGIRRAGLPFAVTQGFSPHMRIAFSAALPVGTGSTDEWYDVILTSYVPAPEALARLTAATPHDLAPLAAGYRDMRDETLGLLITRQDYLIRLAGCDPAALTGALDALVAQGEIPYRRGKKQKALDLGATLAAYQVDADGDGCALTLHTRSSNAGSLRPEILLAALDGHLAGAPDTPVTSGALDARVLAVRSVTRTAQYGVTEEGARVDPLAPDGAQSRPFF